MKPEELTTELKGAIARARLDDVFDDARVAINSWSTDKRTVFVTVLAPYGKRFREGTRVQVPIEDVWIPEK